MIVLMKYLRSFIMLALIAYNGIVLQGSTNSIEKDSVSQYLYNTLVFYPNLNLELRSPSPNNFRINYWERKKNKSEEHEKAHLTLTSSVLRELTGSISLEYDCKYDELQDVKLLINGYTRDNRLTLQDSLTGEELKSAAQIKHKIKMDSIALLKLEWIVEATDKPTGFFLDFNNFNLRPVDIKINGDLGSASQLASITELDKDKWLDDKIISLIDTVPILALGEFYHGSESIVQTAYDIMKYRVMECNCRLLLFEVSQDKLLGVNRYIQSRLSKDSLLQSGALDLGLSSKTFLDFLDWLKEFNKKEENPVRVFGIDIESSDWGYTSLYNIYQFLRISSANHKLSQAEIAEVRDFVLNETTLAKSLKSFNDRGLIFLDSLETNVIDNFSQMREKAFESINPFMMRDYYMAKNIKYLIDKVASEGETITILSHALHSGYDYQYTSLPTLYNPFGYYMRKWYGMNYKCVGLTVGEGTRMTLTPRGSVVKEIQKNQNDQMGSYFYKYDKPLAYMSSKHSNLGALIVSVGTLLPDQQLIQLMPTKMFEGIIYISNSTPVQLINDQTNANEMVIERIRELFSGS